ncbi:MAG: serine/threonine-protein kinase [Polyangiales bacterium]
MLSRGDILGARFRLVDKVGEGGMGVVWLAHDEKLGCDVALKVLHAALLGDEHSAARLRNEARAAAKVAHPGICRVLDVGEHVETPFLVMELLRGQSLAALLEREKTLAPELAVSVAESVLETLAAAHAEGVLHRDMKPENVFLCDDGAVKVLDFGVAKILDEGTREKLTRTGALIGTPAYMAPEQARGLPSDERGDLWSVGVMLFEMLSGSLPFSAANYQGMLMAIATNRAPSIADRAPSLDAALVALVDRALAVSLSERWSDARSFAAALTQWREQRGVARTSAAPSSSNAGRRTPRRSPREQAILTMTDPDRVARRRRKLALVVSGLVLSVLALVVRGAIRRANNGADNGADAQPSAPLARDAGALRSATIDDAAVLTPLAPDAAAPVDDVATVAVTDAATASRGDGAAGDAARVRARRGRRADGGASAGIGRDPDF